MAWGISQLFNLTVGPSERAEERALIVQKEKKKRKKRHRRIKEPKAQVKAGIPTMDLTKNASQQICPMQNFMSN